MTVKLDEPNQSELTRAYAAATKRLLLLDYDGTLIKFAPTPDEATPTPSALGILMALGSDTRNTVVLISGRPAHVLDEWFGHIPIRLVAEHGAFTKDDHGWQTEGVHSSDWKKLVKQLMAKAAKASPGMFVEDKITALVLHHRAAANHDDGLSAVRQTIHQLPPLLAKYNLRYNHIDEALEVRPMHISKGKNALNWLQADKYGFVLAAGDSATDEDMFEILPASTFTIKIGKGPTAARYRTASPSSFVQFLQQLSTY